MPQQDKLGADIEYVRAIVDEAEAFSSPAPIYWLWALISLVGFPLFDHDPRAGGVFWSIAGPLGGIASYLIGRAWSRRSGQRSRRIARYHALHWTGMLGAIFLAVMLAANRGMSDATLTRIILLILAFGYYTAGIYLDRRILWNGLLLAGCFVAMLVFTGLGWTFVGILLALSLVLSSLSGRRGGRGEG